MSLIEQASLVLIPSGYKEDTVYSVIPSNGSGDMSFTRASDGTRINSDGLVEVTPWNLLTYSEDFSNGAWIKTNATIVANDAIAPNGTTTADKFTTNSTISETQVRTSSFSILSNVGIPFTTSVYAKKGTANFLRIRNLFSSVTVIERNGWFNLNTGTLGTIDSGQTGTITDVGNGWYRCTLTGLVGASGNANLVDIGFTNTDNTYFPTTSVNGYIWGAQLNIGSTAKPYFPTTDRLNVPRLTYQNGGGGCPSLLLEPQRTNIITYSEQFNNGAWTLDGDGVGQSVTANYSISPDGTQNADRLQLNKTGGTYSRIRQDKSGAGTYAWSVYMKSNTSASQNVGLRLDSTGINCVVTTSWQRFTLNATVGTPQAQILLFDSIVGNDETADISVWGAQLEVGAYPSSYIPTVASSATRIADACSKTGISSLIGQTEGTLFFDGIVNNIQNPTSNIINTNRTATTISTIALTKVKATNKIRFEQFLGNGTFVNIPLLSTNSFADGVRTKVAIRYKSGDFAMYINGNLEATNASTYTNIGVKTELYLNDVPTTFAYQESVSFNQVILFTALTNAQLATLTTI